MNWSDRYRFYREIVERHGVYTPPFSFGRVETVGSVDEVISSWKDVTIATCAKPETSVYVHVPFCSRRRCSFCMYRSVTDYTDADLQAYADYVAEVAAAWRAVMPESLSNLYIGGGTPSVYSPEGLRALLSPIRGLAFDSRCERTCEMSPSTATEAHVEAIAEAGLNRLSMGVQSFDARVVEAVNREPVSDGRIFALCSRARRCGFADVNLDLMLGLPCVDEKNIRESVRKTCESGALSGSVYYWRQSGETRADMIRQFSFARDEFARFGWRLVSGSEASEHHLFFSPERAWNTRRYNTSPDAIGNGRVVGLGLCANGFTPGLAYSCDAPDSFRIWLSDAGRQYRMAAAHMLYASDGRLDGPRFEAAFGARLDEVFAEEIALLCEAGAIEEDEGGLRIGGHGPEDRMAKQMVFWDHDYLMRTYGGGVR